MLNSNDFFSIVDNYDVIFKYQDDFLKTNQKVSLYDNKFYEIKDKNVFLPQNIKKNLRKCRFCNEKYPNIEFKNISHVIPESIGNRNLISSYECDSCNSRFSKYEDHFLNYLGNLTRVHFGFKGKNRKNVKYKVKSKEGNKIELKREKNNLIRIIQDDSHRLAKISEINPNIIDLKVPKYPYNLNLVYKSLVKMAISCLPDQEIQYFKDTLIWLKNEECCFISDFKFLLYGYKGMSLSHSKNLDFTIMKRKGNLNYPYNLCVIYFHNYFFQFYIPFCVKDLNINQMLFPPPQIYPIDVYNIEFKDFSNYEVINNDFNQFEIINKGKYSHVKISKEDFEKLSEEELKNYISTHAKLIL